MRDKHKEMVIKAAIQQYRDADSYGFHDGVAQAVKMMEQVFYMCSRFNIDGISDLKKALDEAKEKYGEELLRER